VTVVAPALRPLGSVKVPDIAGSVSVPETEHVSLGHVPVTVAV
jgi:hypothetical protein